MLLLQVTYSLKENANGPILDQDIWLWTRGEGDIKQTWASSTLSSTLREEEIVLSQEDTPRYSYYIKCPVFFYYSPSFIPNLEHLLFLLLKLPSCMYLRKSQTGFIQFHASHFSPVVLMVISFLKNIYLKNHLDQLSKKLTMRLFTLFLYESYIIKLKSSSRLTLSKPSLALK